MRLVVFLILVVLSTCQITIAKFQIAPTFHPASQVSFDADFHAALAAIGAADPALAKMIEVLDLSKTVYQIVKTEGVTTSLDLADGKQYVLFNPDLDIQFPGEGMCVDPTAGLAHELWHKYDIDRCKAGIAGTFCDPADRSRINRTSDSSTNNIRRSELAAVNAENLYRLGAKPKSLCLRWKYGNNPLPAPFLPATHCEVLSPETKCSIPVLPATVQKYCCMVYDYDGKGNTCWKDYLTIRECSGSLTMDPRPSAAEYPHPCSEANMKHKPCPF